MNNHIQKRTLKHFSIRVGLHNDDFIRNKHSAFITFILNGQKHRRRLKYEIDTLKCLGNHKSVAKEIWFDFKERFNIHG